MGIKGLAKLLSDEAPDVRFCWCRCTFCAMLYGEEIFAPKAFLTTRSYIL
jgi:hypothetical protein